MIVEELRRFACAAQFLTRLPVPELRPWRDDRLARSARYFSLVGLLVGGICAAVLLMAREFWPHSALPALLAVAAGTAITGGFHEDGLADTADGLGGGQTREQKLAIMKDSRLGAFGALALGLVVAAKVLALAAVESPLAAAAVLLGAHGLGRASAVLMMVVTPYAADPDASRVRPSARGVRAWEAGVGVAIGAAPLMLLTPGVAAACVAGGVLAALLPALAARRLIGGYTGDVAGAVEQAFETGFLLAAAAAVQL